MSSAVTVTIHSSQFPEVVRGDLLESLRTRRVNHKFHYDSVKQTQKWLALHQAYSPSRNDADCAATYNRAFTEAVTGMESDRVHVIGLGCGGGQKDARLLKLLRDAGKEISYTPSDVSTAMVLVAREAALAALPEQRCFPLVCDMATTDDLSSVLSTHHEPRASRLITFFGMIPNFEQQDILPKLAALVRPGDTLLFSANLAPGPDYTDGMRHVLPQYDNTLTQEWLLTFLLDLGVERADGEVKFEIEDDLVSGLKRLVARFDFARVRELIVEAEHFRFCVGDTVRLFFSYRHTPALVRSLLERHGLEVRDQWLTTSGEEGVFLVRRRG